MIALQDEEGLPVTASPRAPRWLPQLEQELKSRIGWADEVVSPFARTRRTARDEVNLPQAA
jgi:hypothetical protein